ncbi:hypothetical protein BDN72DRAFT_899186 [Pluteus cervinus]|uniref:Uncharacterized protein n=1 Tax=Pluteus cervinus TaxID=181527 RepID=A0ACD3ANT0_9AGAR|nr:hypothetical protein BDN72DRAFT_899186 [Pluteus cervinus]
MHATLNDLAVELLSEILWHTQPTYPKYLGQHEFPDDPTRHYLNQWLGDIASLNHAWYSAATPILYSTIRVTTERGEREGVERRLESVKKHGRFVKYLTLDVAYRGGEIPFDTDFLSDLGAHLPSCTHVRFLIHPDATENDVNHLYTTLISFDHPKTQLRSIQITSHPLQTQLRLPYILSMVPTVVASQLEALEISGWRPTLEYLTVPSRLQSKFSNIQRLSLDRIVTYNQDGRNDILEFALSITLPLSSLRSLYLSESNFSTSSITSFLQTPVVTSSNMHTTAGFNLTYLHINGYPAAFEGGGFDLLTTPFHLVNLCPHLTTFLYFVPCPKLFLLPGEKRILELEDVTGSIPQSLVQLGLQIMNSYWPSPILSGTLDAIVRWAKTPEDRKNVKELVLRCDAGLNSEDERTRVEEELGKLGMVVNIVIAKLDY